MSNAQSWIARRYFFSRKKTRFLPFLTAIAIAGVALGTCAMVVVLSVMQGFNRELERRLLGFNAHITITPESSGEELTPDMISDILGKQNLLEAIPFVEGEVIIEAKIGDELFAQGARLRGVDPKSLGTLKNVRYYFPESSTLPEAALSKRQSSTPGIILGNEILSQLNVHPDFYDIVEVIAPLADVGPSGEMEPRLKKFMLLGSFASGVYEYDNHFALVNIDEAESVLGAQAHEGWQLRISNPGSVAAAVNRLSSALGKGYRVEGWHTHNKKLFAALKLERVAMGGVLTLVVLIASFSVVGVIMMVVSSKRKDIALLKAMGMQTSRVRGVFVRQGMWIGIIGACIGTAVGVAVCLALMQWPIKLPESYYVETLVVYLNPALITIVVGLGIMLATLASIYPVRRVANEDPIAALRYE